MAFVSVPLISEALLPWLSWQHVLGLMGIASLLMAAAFAFWGQGGRFHGQAPNWHAFRPLIANPAFWIMALLFGLAIGGSMGVFSMLPLYLVAERGIPRDSANLLISLSRISSVAVAFVSGWATDRFGPRQVMATVFFLTGILTMLLGIGPDPWIILLVFLQPLLAVCFFPAGFAALSSILPADARNVAVSLTIPLAYLLGGGVFPVGIGMFGDAGVFSWGIAAAGALIMTGAVFSLCLKISKPEGNEAPS
jgi:NNP family nitrate/nitrite transporter-like MFS transporter